MDPLSAVSLGLGALNAIGGLFGGGGKRYRLAQERLLEREALRSAEAAQARRAMARSGLLAIAGGNASDLVNAGRGLGASLAAGGVYNASSVGGVLAKEKASQDAAVLRAALEAEAGIRADEVHARESRLGMQYDTLGQQAAEAEARKAQSLAGMASFLKELSAVFPRAPKRVPSEPPMTPSVVVPAPQPQTGQPRMSGPRMEEPSAVYDPVQSPIQRVAFANRYELGVPSAQWLGPVLNGNYNGALGGYGLAPRPGKYDALWRTRTLGAY